MGTGRGGGVGLAGAGMCQREEKRQLMTWGKGFLFSSLGPRKSCTVAASTHEREEAPPFASGGLAFCQAEQRSNHRPGRVLRATTPRTLPPCNLPNERCRDFS